MSWLSILVPAAKFVFGGIVDSIKQGRAIKAREDAAEHNLKLAVLQAKITKAQQDGEWEVEAVKRSGWKADALFVVVMLPLVLCFIPGMVQYVQGGFMALDAAIPDWWKAMVGATVAVSYGLKAFAKSPFKRKPK